MSGTPATLAVLRCRACATVSAWPGHACAACGSTDREAGWAVGKGRIHSVTVIHRPPESAGTMPAPYAIALVALDIGGRLMARVPAESRIGDAVMLRRQGLRDMPEIVPGAAAP